MRTLPEVQVRYAGPTKRSADVDDFTALEAEVAKMNDECAQLRKRINESQMRERALLDQVAWYEKVVSVNRDVVSAYADACAATVEEITTTTPFAAIDAALARTRLARRIADAVLAATRARPKTTKSTKSKGGYR